MDSAAVRKFRNNLRILEREWEIENKSCCCGGVTLSQCHVLLELDRTNNITLNQLSEMLDIDKGSVSKTVEKLVNANLIARTIPKEDRRVTRLSLTDDGIKVCNEINSSNDGFFKEVLGAIPEHDLPIFQEAFEILVNSMRRTKC